MHRDDWRGPDWLSSERCATLRTLALQHAMDSRLQEWARARWRRVASPYAWVLQRRLPKEPQP